MKTKRSWNAVEFSPEREWVEWGMHKGAIAILMKGVLDKGRCWKDGKSGNVLHQQDNSHCPMVGRWDS